MKLILKTEEAAMFALPLFFFYQLNLPGWWFWAFLLAPDISMLGYLVNTKTGAFTYNLFYHKGIAIAVFILGIFLSSVMCQFIGIILFAHSSLDRMLGYGLKYDDSFQHTHLGMIGKNKK
jgi:hypothetical protein